MHSSSEMMHVCCASHSGQKGELEMNYELDCKKVLKAVYLSVKRGDFYHKQMNLFAKVREKTNGD